MDIEEFKDFDWGGVPPHTKKQLIFDITHKLYEMFFKVEEGDVVVDIGAFIGTFTYSILRRNPEHCWVIEPVEHFFKTTYNNLKNNQVSFVRGALSNDPTLELTYCGEKSVTPGINFKQFIQDNCIEKIDFLKTDCEGGEYLIFTEENIDFLKNNVKKIAGEFHLDNPNKDVTEKNEQFRNFRDNFLVRFNKYHVRSVDLVDIKWDLFNEHFIEYYKEVLIFIDNR